MATGLLPPTAGRVSLALSLPAHERSLQDDSSSLQEALGGVSPGPAGEAMQGNRA